MWPPNAATVAYQASVFVLMNESLSISDILDSSVSGAAAVLAKWGVPRANKQLTVDWP